MTDIQNYQPATDLLKDRIILITGAAGAIGTAVAKACATYGATIILLDKSIPKLEKLYDEIEQAGHPQPAIIPADLAGASPADYETIVETLDKEFGRLDGLLHTAAFLGNRTPIEQYNLEEWNKSMQINLTAPFLLTRACLPLLKKSGDASIIFTTAEVGRHGKAYWGAYGIANAALENLMQILADETENNTSIRVNSVDPGSVNSSLWVKVFPGVDPTTWAKPEDIVNGYVYLLGEDSKGHSGKQFNLQNQPPHSQ